MRRFGGPEVLEPAEVPDPRPAAGEVVVSVEACAVNRVDLDLRAGGGRVRLELPHILGREVAGQIQTVGESVEDWRPGERVVVLPIWPCGACERCRAGDDNLCPRARQPGISAPGGYAELLAAPAAQLLRLPDQLSTDDAAASLISFGTAWRLLVTLARVAAGETVLVPGASGGLGRAAVQVAALRGARVIAAASSPAKLDGLKELGATELVDYGSGSLAAAVAQLTAGRGVDVAVEQTGGPLFEQVLDSLAPRGRVVVAGAHAGREVTVDLVRLYLREGQIIGSRSQRRAELEEVFAHVVAGRLRPQPAERFPLWAAVEAHRRLESRAAMGKLILKP